jgi:hypothetical protein
MTYTKDYFLSLSKSKSEWGSNIFSVNEKLITILPHLYLPIADVYEIINHFIEEIKGDWAISSTFKAVQKFSESENKGFALLNYIIENEFEIQENVITNILLGLYKANPDLTYQKCLQLLTIEKYRNESLSVLANLKYHSKEHFDYTFNIILSHNFDDENSIIRLIGFLINSIISSYISSINVYICFNKLKELATLSPNIQNTILYHFFWLKKHDQEKTEIILLMDLQNPLLHYELNRVLDDLQDIKCFFKILRKVILDCKVNFKPDTFYSIRVIHQKYPKEFSDGLINLLIDREGAIRFKANRIISILQAYHKRFDFAVDLLSYSGKIQHEILASLSGIYSMQLDNFLHLILPFRKSKYEKIRVLLLGKLEILTENYSTQVIDILRKELNENDLEDKTLLDLIISFEQTQHSNFVEKIKIKELNSRHNQSKRYREFTLKNEKKLSEQMAEAKKIHEEKSWLRMIGKVVIARGKSWKIENSHQKDFSPLGHISVSSTIPREMMINSDRYEWDAQIELNQIWE